MANNVEATAGSGTTFKTTDNAGVHTGHVNVDSIAAGDNNIGNIDVATVPADPFGANADAASATGSISAKLRAIATALGVSALDLGVSTGGSRTLRVAIDTSQVGAAITSQGAFSAGAVQTSLPSDHPSIQTRGVSAVFDFTPSCHTGANTAGDVVAATEALSSICRANDAPVTLVSLMVIDAADQKAELDLWFFDANTTLGTEDAAPDIDDTEVLTVQGRVNVPTTAYYDLGGASVAQVELTQPIVLKPASGTDDIYFAVTTAGTPTYGASSLKFRFGVLKD